VLTDSTRSVPLSKLTVLVPGLNLLGLQPKRFKVTTDSNHKFEVYLNLSCSDEAEAGSISCG